MFLPSDHTRLITWFERHQRDFPWRNCPTPYEVWVSEIMLQQTQASVVVPYFLRWMECFPTIQALAQASSETVIKVWEGLGYYSRARNLHEGARFIVENCNGLLPNNAEQLSRIKGIGPYTVGAILSFAFHQKAAAVDGNVMRVITRYLNMHDDIAKTQTVKNITEIVRQLLPEEHPWIAMEALIELGATICKKKPQCSSCPLRSECAAFAQNTYMQLPHKSTKQTREFLYRAVPVIVCENKVLLRREEKGKVMADLHEFPYFPLESADDLSEEYFKQLAHRHLGIQAKSVQILSKISHSFTRFQAVLYPALIETTAKQDTKGYQWHELKALPFLAFSAGHRRILRLISC